jgi:hypothetical protein
MKNGVVQASKSTALAIPWTDSGLLLELPSIIPSHIISGTFCEHSLTKSFVGRVKEAHCIDDLEASIGDCDGITIAMTWGVESSKLDVCAWVAERYIMTVVKRDDQCLACAVDMALSVRALVVVW